MPARFFKSRPYFRPKVPFSTPVFRPDLQNPYPISEKAEIMSSLLRLEGRQKNSSNPFRIRIFLFLSYSFRIETINTFIHSDRVVSLENHTQFQTKMGKIFTCFPAKTRKNPTDEAAHTYIVFIGVQSYPVTAFLLLHLGIMLSDVLQVIKYKSYRSAVKQLTDLHELSITALHFDIFEMIGT